MRLMKFWWLVGFMRRQTHKQTKQKPENQEEWEAERD